MSVIDPIADVAKLCDHSSMRWPYPRTPMLGKALPTTYADGKIEFDKRVKSRFPLGCNEAELIAYVGTEGVKLNREAGGDFHSATLIRGLIIRTIWSIRWRSKAGKIEDVWGVYGAIAP